MDEVATMPLWLSVVPPLVAILMALLFREVISALVTGILLGAVILEVYAHGAAGILTGFLAVIDKYVVAAITEWEHAAIIVFSLTIGGMVGIVSANGGMQGIVEKLSKYATSRRSGQLVTWMMGVAIFFDDYANSLVVGNTMRPVTDRLRISREKLSYIVDSTAAPVSAIAFITTWIGAELSYIQDGIKGSDITESPYSIFFSSLQYSFYPVLTLLFILLLIRRNRDFGPMWYAERRAMDAAPVESQGEENHAGGELQSFRPAEGVTPRWYNAVIPIFVLICGAIAGLLVTGVGKTGTVLSDAGIAAADGSFAAVMAGLDGLRPAPEGFFQKMGVIIGNADSYSSLLWASLAAAAAAVVLTAGGRIMSLERTMAAMMSGFRAMFTAVIILVLAWSLAALTKEMRTADYITGVLLSGGMAPALLPVLTFVIAALVAFSTGSSWGTMAILYPLVLPASLAVCDESGFGGEEKMAIFYNVVACVLAGAVLGDHCSPISDTTILSSLATSCNHIAHVRTQLPYALTVGAVSVLAGTLPSALGVPPYVTFPAGIAALYFVITYYGKKVES